MYRMALMVLFLQSNDDQVDANKCLRMALVHDLQECLVGDITPTDGITREEKYKRELEAVKEIQKLIPTNNSNNSLFYDLWKEYEDYETKESKYVHALDKLEMILQASEYEESMRGVKLDSFFESTKGLFSDFSQLKELDKVIRDKRREQQQQQQQQQQQ
ncbi:hypothetical protein MP638_005275 [Amoeboaphelidium occidentale]|nr:hypothetical protein MP638_005275 [Amoeboaphelidium occidentale]